MVKAILLHTVEDAKHCVNNNLFQNTLLFSTHSSVDVYLRVNHKIECVCISTFITLEEIKLYRVKSFERVERLLQDLDEKKSSELNSIVKTNILFFKSLYLYHGKIQYFTYKLFALSIKKINQKFNIDTWEYYDCKTNTMIKHCNSFTLVFQTLFPTLRVKLISRKVIKTNSLLTTFKKYWFELTNIFIYKTDKIEKLAKKQKLKKDYKIFLKKRKTILVSENLYNLSFLHTKINKYNVVYYENNNPIFPVSFQGKNISITSNVENLVNDFISISHNSFDRLFLQDIQSHFSKNVAKYLSGLVFLKKIHTDFPIQLGIWGNPPNKEFKALIFAFLRSKNISILGGQHGASYGVHENPLHIDSDYTKCTHYISYGFVKKDLERLYPKVFLDVKIFPFGQKETKKIVGDQTIDILFPITNNNSFFHGGMKRTPCDKLVERQIRFLKHLNALKKLKVCVKPFQFATSANYAMIPLHSKLKNLTFLDKVSLLDFLRKYTPKIVLIEYASTPLYEVMELDTEIFVMGNTVCPIEKEALKMLEKRVHYSDNIDDIIQKMTAFLAGKIKPKRNMDFYTHYIAQNNLEENTLALIEELVR